MHPAARCIIYFSVNPMRTMDGIKSIVYAILLYYLPLWSILFKSVQHSLREWVMYIINVKYTKFHIDNIYGSMWLRYDYNLYDLILNTVYHILLFNIKVSQSSSPVFLPLLLKIHYFPAGIPEVVSRGTSNTRTCNPRF